jgi:hypothetical protein
VTTEVNAGTSIIDAHNQIDSALSILDSVGRLRDADPIIADVAGSTNYGHIDSDQELTHDARLDRYSAAYAKTQGTLAQRLSRAATIAKTQHTDDHAAAFGILSPSLAQSHRDATALANTIVDPRARQSAIADAIADGDTVLARALTKSAVAASDLASVNRFSDEFPHLDPPLQRLWDAARSKGDVRQLGLAAYNAKDALKPPAISSLAPYQIDARAQRKAQQ